jgi:hypothetical protein
MACVQSNIWDHYAAVVARVVTLAYESWDLMTDGSGRHEANLLVRRCHLSHTRRKVRLVGYLQVVGKPDGHSRGEAKLGERAQPW